MKDGPRFRRFVAVDWSGARDAAIQRRAIWVCTIESGGEPFRVTELRNRRARQETVAYLSTVAADGRPTLVGLDFPFSYPERFLDVLGVDDFQALLRRMRRESGRIAQFVNRTIGPWWRKWATDDLRGRRVVEREPGARGAESPLRALRVSDRRYDFTGAKQVGKAAITGMAAIGDLLGRVPEARVWPFHPDWSRGSPVLAEIWPRLALGRVVKTDSRARRLHVADLQRQGLRLSAAQKRDAVASDDALDALTSALEMARGGWRPAELARLPAAAAREGWILGIPWNPGAREALPDHAGARA